jgi:hypothetical protein
MPFRWRNELSPEYNQAIGNIVAQWGYLESRFYDVHQCLRAHPEAAKLIKRLSAPFQNQARIMVEAARICFPQAPSLVAKIDALVTEACNLSEQRHRLIHGFWMEFRLLPEYSVQVWKYERDGRQVIYTASTDDLKAHAVDVMDCHGKLLDIFMDWGDFPGSELASHEKSALRAFRASYRQNFPQTMNIPTQPPPRSFRV